MATHPPSPFMVWLALWGLWNFPFWLFAMWYIANK